MLQLLEQSEILNQKVAVMLESNPISETFWSPDITNASINVGYVRFNKALTVLTLDFFMLQFYFLA